MRTVYTGQTVSLPITVYNQAGAVISATISSAYLSINAGSPINCTINGQTLVVIVPGQTTLGTAAFAWSWHQVGSDGYTDDPSFTESVTVALSVPALTGPLTATSAPSPMVSRVGDTLPSFLIALADANGPVDVSNAALTLLVRSAWDDDNIPGGTVVLTGTIGTVQCRLPPLIYDGLYYGQVFAVWPDGSAASFPNTSAGFAITEFPSIATS